MSEDPRFQEAGTRLLERVQVAPLPDVVARGQALSRRRRLVRRTAVLAGCTLLVGTAALVVTRDQTHRQVVSASDSSTSSASPAPLAVVTSVPTPVAASAQYLVRDRSGQLWVSGLAALVRFDDALAQTGAYVPESQLPDTFGAGPIALSSDGSLLLVTASFSNDEVNTSPVLARVDTTSGQMTLLARLPRVLPTALVESGDFALVGAGSTVYRVNLRDGTIVNRDVGGTVRSMALVGDEVWAATTTDLTRLKVADMTTSAEPFTSPADVAASSDGRVFTIVDDAVVPTDTRAPIPLAVGRPLRLAADGRRLWVYGDRGLAEIDTQSLATVGNTEFATRTFGVIMASGSDAWLTNTEPATLTRMTGPA